MFLKDYNKTAFIFDNNEYTYSDLIKSVNHCSSYLDVNNGDRVILYCENNPQWIYGFYALWQCGAVVIPIDSTVVGDEFSEIIDDAEPSHILCSSDSFGRAKNEILLCKNKNPLIINIDELMNKSSSADDSDVTFSNNEEDIALIMYTSGTTSKPKGVMLSYRNLKASVDSLAELKMLTENDRLLALLPFHHIFPLQGSVIGPFYVGASIVFVKNLVAEEILDTLQKYPVTIFLGVPRLYELFYNSIIEKIKQNVFASIMLKLTRLIGSQKLGALLFKKVHSAFGGQVHSYLTGGAKMDPYMAKDLWAMGFSLVEGYGATETAPLISFNPVKKIKLGTVGKPMNGTEVSLSEGEIIVKGPNVMKGYYKLPNETAKVMKDGWFYTGDLGEFDNDGYLTITSRKDAMIVLPNGKNINPEEIENAILKMSPFVKEIGVVQSDGQLMAYVLPDLLAFKKENMMDIFETIKWKVIDKYNSSTSSYKKILNVKLVKEELPKTRLGKLKRFLLKDLDIIKEVEGEIVSENLSDEYKYIESFFKERKYNIIRPSDHIELDLGLDSLDKVEFHSFLELTFGLKLDKEIFSKYSTLESIADYLGKMKTRSDVKSVNWNEILNENSNFKINAKSFRRPILLWLTGTILKSYFSLIKRIENEFPERPFLIVPNHQSFLDVLILIVLLPKEVIEHTYFFIKDSFFVTRLVKFLTRNRNIIIINIEKDLKGALQKSAAVLRHKKNIIIFPEGKRSRFGKLQTFKKTFAILSKELKIPIVPIAITGAYDLLPYGSTFPKRGEIICTVLESQHPHLKSYEEIVEDVGNKIKSVVQPDLN